MNGQTVTVENRVLDGVDRYKKPVYKTVENDVENVLVAPGATSDAIEANRPEHVIVSYTLYFPKTYTGKLDGLRVRVAGEWFKVVGCPRPYDPDTTPTPYNMKAEVEADDG